MAMNDASTDATVIVVSYDSAPHLPRCVDSVLAQQNVDAQLIVVDNKSRDNSVEILRGYGERITLIESETNRGFAAANNLAAGRAVGRHLFLLNPDAVFRGDQALARMVRFLDDRPECGLAGTRLVDAEGRAETHPFAIYPRQQHLTTPLEALPGKIAWLLAASVIVRREVYETIGGFDEGYFLYGEDTDLCIRIRKAGYTIEHHGEVEVEHLGGASERTTAPYDLWTRKQVGLFRFFEKHYDRASAEHIVKRDLRAARVRLALLGALRHVGHLSPRQGEKYEKYRALRDTALRFLET